MSRLAAALSGLLLASSCGISALGLAFGPDTEELARLPETAWQPARAVLIEEKRLDFRGSTLFSYPARIARVYGTDDDALAVRRSYLAELATRGWILDPQILQSEADPAWNWWCRGSYAYFLLIETPSHPSGIHAAGFPTAFDAGTSGRIGLNDCPTSGVREAVFGFLVICSFVSYIFVAQIARSRNVRARGPAIRREHGIAHNAAYLVFLPYLVIALHLGPEIPLPDPVRWLGVASALIGIGLALWSLAVLGRNYDLELAVHAEHDLVRSGPYRFVRHPVYSGLALHLVGACLATGNALLTAGVLVAGIPLLMARARVEERLMRDEFGADYDRYVDEVPMLVPGLRARGGKR